MESISKRDELSWWCMYCHSLIDISEQVCEEMLSSSPISPPADITYHTNFVISSNLPRIKRTLAMNKDSCLRLRHPLLSSVMVKIMSSLSSSPHLTFRTRHSISINTPHNSNPTRIRMGGFDYVIVTAPNEYLCAIYQLQLNHLCQSLRSFSQITACLCIADPEGVRIGSGGGTLNALSKLIDRVGESEIMNSKVAIIHSGGDSRRSPLQSVVGKAWAQINSSFSSGAADGSPSTPLTLLIQELEIVAEGMSEGSLVIASSDVLVSLSSVCSALPPSSSQNCRINPCLNCQKAALLLSQFQNLLILLGIMFVTSPAIYLRLPLREGCLRRSGPVGQF
jgi:hypothetical protein